MNSVTAGAPPLLAVYGYDLDGRLVTKGLENGPLSTMAYDNANQLTGITHAVGVTGVDSIGYTLDMRGRRTGISRTGGRNDGYSYDAAGQVIAGGYDATAAGSQTDGFAYDAAGNRTQSARNGAGTAYTPNVADEYASVGGTAQAYDPAGNQTTLQLPGGPFIALTYDAESSRGTEARWTQPCDSRVRARAERPNQNRLTSEEKSTGIARADKARVVNSYDSLQRRVRKQIYARNTADTGWTLQKTVLFTYEGWSRAGGSEARQTANAGRKAECASGAHESTFVIEEREFLTSALTPASTYYRYTWGADVSGSRQGAGGVGGLIMTEEVPASGTATAHFYAYDGNGNVTHVLDATGTVEAQYRYSAFGGDLGSTTSTAFAQRNPWRFSTKYLDREVEASEGFYYYGYRHYFTALGRWGSRDPIGEDGGVNLYGMVGNEPVSSLDLLGRLAWVICNRCAKNKTGAMACINWDSAKGWSESYPSNEGPNTNPVPSGIPYDVLPKPASQMNSGNEGLTGNVANGRINGPGGEEYPQGTPSITHPSTPNNPGQVYPDKPQLNNHRMHGPGLSEGCHTSKECGNIQKMMERNLNKGGTHYKVYDVDCPCNNGVYGPPPAPEKAVPALPAN